MTRRYRRDAFAGLIEAERARTRREKKVFSLVFDREERRKKPVMLTIIEQLSKRRPRISDEAVKKKAKELFAVLKKMGYVLNY